MAGGPAHHLAQRRHRRAEHAGRGPPCARVCLRDLRWHRRDRWLRRDGAVRGWARPGGGRARIGVGGGWFGHGVFPWYVGSVAASSATAGERPAGTLRRRMWVRGRARAGSVAGTVGCTQAEPPAASLPLLCDEMASGRPGRGRPPRGLGVAGLHRSSLPRARISARQRPSGTGTVGRDAALRASWSAAIVMTATDAHELLR